MILLSALIIKNPNFVDDGGPNVSIENRKKGLNIDRIAVPSMEKGGLSDKLSGHFGHCPVFTVMDLEGKKIKNVNTLINPPHNKADKEKSHMLAVNLLKENGVNIVIEGGIGKEHLMGLEQVGIKVLAGTEGTVEFNVKEYMERHLSVGKADVGDPTHEHEHKPGHHDH